MFYFLYVRVNAYSCSKYDLNIFKIVVYLFLFLILFLLLFSLAPTGYGRLYR